MGDLMRLMVLSGISQQIMRQLEHDKIKTIEIKSPHNFLSAIEMNVGDMIFLTSTSQQDIRSGTSGLIARINQTQIAMQRIIQKDTEFYEEAEFQLVRLQLELKGNARVRRAECCALGEATIVDADEVLFFEGR